MAKRRPSGDGMVRKRPDGRKLSGSTIRNIHGVLHEAMDAAAREGLTARNPTEGVIPPKKKPPAMKILNDKQHARNVYAKTEAECEEKLKALIREMKAEIAEAKALSRQAEDIRGS